jgi:hypothetical protein
MFVERVKQLLPETLRDQLRDQLIAYRSAKIVRAVPSLRFLNDPAFLFPIGSDQEHIAETLNWISWASSQKAGGGIPQLVNVRQFALEGGVTLAPSYPETTGYMLCTLIFGRQHQLPTASDAELNRLLEYLLSAQLPDGSFPPPGNGSNGLAFDTGQVLTGLVAYHRHVDTSAALAKAIEKAARWLSDEVEADGSYSERSSYNGKRAYYIRASMGLIHAAKEMQRRDWLEAAARNAEWTLRLRDGPTWFRRFSFEDGAFQNLHGIAYTLRGLIDLGRHLGRDDYIEASRSCIDAMVFRSYPDLPAPHALPGYFARSFARYRRTVSPTGMCQVALSCMLLGRILNDERYAAKGRELIGSVKQFHFRGLPERAMNGLLPGSWPITGPYMHCSLPNWPIKFFLDGLYICQGADPLGLEG